MLELKNNYSSFYKIDIIYKNKLIKLNAFLDTGNKLIDPITKVPVIIVKEKYFHNVDKFSLVPYSSINDTGVIKCIEPEQIYINNKEVKQRIKLGLVKKIDMEGIGCILSPNIGEIC